MLKNIVHKIITGLISFFTLKAIREKRVTKLQIIIAAVVLGAALVVAGVIKSRYDQRRQEEKERREQLHQDEEMRKLMEPSETPLSPEEILAREKKLGGEDVAVLIEEGRKKREDLQQAISDASRKKKGLTKEDIMVVADEGLPDMLRQVLVEGDPGLVYKALCEMKERGLNAVKVLREEIINNPDDAAKRKSALIAMFYIGDENVVPYLKTAAKVDPDEEVRAVALFCLDFLTGKEESDFFEGIEKNDPSETVREKAREYREFRNQE